MTFYYYHKKLSLTNNVHPPKLLKLILQIALFGASLTKLKRNESVFCWLYLMDTILQTPSYKHSSTLMVGACAKLVGISCGFHLDGIAFGVKINWVILWGCVWWSKISWNIL